MGRKGKKKSQQPQKTQKQKQKSEDGSKKLSKSQQHQQSSHSTKQAQQQQATKGTQEAGPSRGTQQQQASQGTQKGGPSRSTQQQQASQGTQKGGPSRGTQQQQASQGTQKAGPSRGTQQQQASQGTQKAGPSRGTQQQQASQGTQKAGPSRGTQQQQASQGTQKAGPSRETQQQQASQSSSRRPSVDTQQQQLARSTQQQASQGTQKAWASLGIQQQQASQDTQGEWPSLGTQQQKLARDIQQQTSRDTQQSQSPHDMQQQQASQGTQKAWASLGTQQQQASQDTQGAWPSLGTQQQQLARDIQQQTSRDTQQSQSPHDMQQQQASQGTQEAWPSLGTQQQQLARDIQQQTSRDTQQSQSPHDMQQQQASQGTQEAWPSLGTQQQQLARDIQQQTSRDTQQSQSPHDMQQQQASQGTQKAWASLGTQQQQASQDTQGEWPSLGTQQQQLARDIQQQTSRDTQQSQSPHDMQQQQASQGTQEAWPSLGTQQQQLARDIQQQTSRDTQQSQSPHDMQQQQASQGTQEAWPSLGTQQQQLARDIQQQTSRDTQQSQSPHDMQQQQASQGTQKAWASLGTQQQQASQDTQGAWPSLGTQQQQLARDIQQQTSRDTQQSQSPHDMQQQQASQGTQEAWPSLGTQQQQLARDIQQQTSRDTQQSQSPHDMQQQQASQGTQEAWPSLGTQQQQLARDIQQQTSRDTQQSQSPHDMQQQQASQGTQEAWPSLGTQQQQLARGIQQQQIPHGTQQQASQSIQQAWPSLGTQQQQISHDTQQQASQITQQAWPSLGTQQQQIPQGTQQQIPYFTEQQISYGTQQWASQSSQQAWPSLGTPQQQLARGMQQQQVPPGTAQAWALGATQQQQVPPGSPQAWASRATQQQQSPQDTQQAWASCSTQQQQSPHGMQQQQVSPSSPQTWASRGTQQQKSPRDTRQALSLSRTKQMAHRIEKSEPKIYEDVKILVPRRPWPSDTKPKWPTSPMPPDKFVSKQQDTSDTKSMHLEYFNRIPLKTSRSGGQAGKKISVETNMLRLNFPKNFQTRVIHYDVSITPDKPKCFLRSVFEKYRVMQFPNRYPAFDGRKNAYSANDLPFGDESKQLEIEVFDREFQKNRAFNIYLKKVAVLDLSWLKSGSEIEKSEVDMKQRCIQALDVILRHGPACQYISVGRSLFQPPEGRIVSLSNGLDLWIGVFQSVIIGSRPYLNIDVAHKGFPTSQPVINLLKEFCKNPKSYALPDEITAADINRNSDKIMKFLKGLKVQYELPDQPTTKRTYIVNGLVAPARENTFCLQDGTSCTVEQYFLQTKKYKIKHYDLPCLWVGSKSSHIHVPLELCTIIAGQVMRKKMDDTQTSKMIREAATNTERRKEKIMNGFAKMNLNRQPTVAKEFHFSVQGEFEKVPARVLQAPVLEYHQRNINVYKGTWRAEKFLNPCTLPDNSWTILNLDMFVRDPELHHLYFKLQECGKSLNMNINKPQTPFKNIKLHYRDVRNVQEYFIEKKQQNIQLVIVILPNVDRAYSVVKQISEIHIHGGIVTQCIKQQTLRKLNDSTIGNILLKINSKLNGINHKLALSHRPPCLNVPCMIVGADVTHPSPDALNIPSIAAVAASHDPNAFQYNVEIRLQSPREEIIADLKKIMKKQLLYFYQRTGHKPRRIIFYRDGVSEGQLTQVIHNELFAIKEAIAELDHTEKCMVPITFFVVQKRHHIRLFPTDKSNSDDKNFNVQAGTIVDSEITHPTQIDFYLVSHASIQGTARPTKYRCIWNENGMQEDEIEELTYYLCHLFARCTRSVSYPAPTYYAHLAAFRARALIHDVDLDINNLEKEQNNKLTLQLNENSPMFFV